MPTRNTKFYSLLLMLVDTLVLLAAFTLAYILRVQYDPRPLLNQVNAYEYMASFLLVVPFWIVAFASLGLYSSQTYNRRLTEWSKLAIGSFIGILLVIGWEYISDQSIFPARLVAAYALIGSFILLVLEREILRMVRSLMFRFKKGIQRVLVIGNSSATADIALTLSDTRLSGMRLLLSPVPQKNSLNI